VACLRCLCVTDPVDLGGDPCCRCLLVAKERVFSILNVVDGCRSQTAVVVAVVEGDGNSGKVSTGHVMLGMMDLVVCRLCSRQI
jgi:hypothetical protein